jgi:hypothetical protein
VRHYQYPVPQSALRFEKMSKRQRSDKQCALAGCDRPAWIGNGITHAYCGRSHAQEALKEQGKELPAPHGSCHTCALAGCAEAVSVESNGRVHEFCCRMHAQEAMDGGTHPRPNEKRAAVAMQCSYPDCASERFVDVQGHTHDYCGRSHAFEAKEKGMAPISTALMGLVSRVWRGREEQVPYTLSVLTEDNPKFGSVAAQFEQAWKHPGTKPIVVRVLQVRNPQPLFDRYVSHAAFLGQRTQGKSTEERRFHGTTMAPSCSFGIEVDQAPCKEADCAVCSICASAFDLIRSGTGPNATAATVATLPSGGLRYGRGLYFSKVSSKSNDYAEKTEREQRPHKLRLMFMCKVSLGQVHVTSEKHLTEDAVTELIEQRGQGPGWQVPHHHRRWSGGRRAAQLPGDCGLRERSGHPQLSHRLRRQSRPRLLRRASRKASEGCWWIQQLLRVNENVCS